MDSQDVTEIWMKICRQILDIIRDWKINPQLIQKANKNWSLTSINESFIEIHAKKN